MNSVTLQDVKLAVTVLYLILLIQPVIRFAYQISAYHKIKLPALTVQPTAIRAHTQDVQSVQQGLILFQTKLVQCHAAQNNIEPLMIPVLAVERLATHATPLGAYLVRQATSFFQTKRAHYLALKSNIVPPIILALIVQQIVTLALNRGVQFVLLVSKLLLTKHVNKSVLPYNTELRTNPV